MPANIFAKGSEWRRWDLHIHTPGTQKNDQFENRGDLLADRWTKYANDINSYPNEIIAIGITDYVSVDNYFKFKSLLASGAVTKPIQAVFPNIELRIIPVTGANTPINIHCIFNPEFDQKIKGRFLAKLKFDNGERIFSASDSDLVELGRSYKRDPNLDETAARREGIGQYVVTVKSIKDIFAEDRELEQNTLVIIANGSKDGNSGLQDHWELIEGTKFSALDVTRQMIYKFSQAIFSGNENDSKYFSGEGVDSAKVVTEKCNSLKPCFHGSDAHENKKIFEPDLKRYCWIKADPSFIGLKQTLYEPRTRVRIQEDKPEEKKPYLVMESVSFVCDPAREMFSGESIFLNDKLNTIIGGKSSGKSLLLYYIAKTVDPLQVNKKLQELGIADDYGFERFPDFDFKVTWGDGTAYKLTDPAAPKTRQITYVPQMYINFLAEKRGEDGLKTLISSFLEEKPAFYLFRQQLQPNHDNAKTNISLAIAQFFQQVSAREKLKEEIKGKGDKAAREANILLKSGQLAELRTASGFTEEDEKKFETLESNRKNAAERLTALNQLQTFTDVEYPAELEKMIVQVQSGYQGLARQIQNKLTSQTFINPAVTKSLEGDEQSIVALLRKIIAESRSKSAKIIKLTALVNARLDAIGVEAKPYLDRIENRGKLTTLLREISEEEAIVNHISELQLSLQLTDATLSAEHEKIISNYTVLLEYYNAIADEINSKPEYAQISQEKQIQLQAFVHFDKAGFAAACTNFINKQSYFSNVFGAYFDADNEYKFDGVNHIANFKDIFKKILTSPASGVRFNQGGNYSNITTALFDDYFSVGYKLTQGSEDILRMSPGKKGLILLFLILHLSNADYPILIDQPEDNLDNRTVYTELKDFIKQKKIERQLIIVTHNANLVVPTDAENVIAANQQGQNAGKDNVTFQFEYITGSLENTFRNETETGILNQMGIKEHVCEILEGGEAAFIEREKRYSLPDH